MDYQKQTVPDPAWLPAVIKRLSLWARGGKGKLFALTCKAFSTVFRGIFIVKLVKCSLERWTGHKVCLESEMQRLVFTAGEPQFVCV